MSTIPNYANNTDKNRANPLTQTWALAVDAYREINSKKLFWITLILSALVPAAIATVGINKVGITFLTWEFDTAPFNSDFISPALFYTYLFVAFAIPLWLTWAAMILAIVSTSSIFPDLLTSGSIELYLSKPISRFRLFLTKYIYGLLFATAQVLLFCLIGFLVIAIRGHEFQPQIFYAVPIVALFFSFLFCVCVLLGVLTRSTLAAMLLTIAFWLVLFGLNFAYVQLQGARILQEIRIERLENRIANPPTTAQSWIAALFDPTREQLEKSRQSYATFRRWENIIAAVRYPLPKTAELGELLTRWTVKQDPILDQMRADAAAEPTEPVEVVDDKGQGRVTVRVTRQQVVVRQRDERSRQSAFFVIGTGLAFEAVIVGLAGWIFCRRDY